MNCDPIDRLVAKAAAGASMPCQADTYAEVKGRSAAGRLIGAVVGLGDDLEQAPFAGNTFERLSPAVGELDR